MVSFNSHNLSLMIMSGIKNSISQVGIGVEVFFSLFLWRDERISFASSFGDVISQ